VSILIASGINKTASTRGRNLIELDNTPRMMRELAQQIRELIKEGLRPINQRVHQLANQLEQQADIEAAIARSRLH
jgi:hypothetical protein